MSSLSVEKLYKSIIAEVIENMKEAIIDEGIDEQVLAELKQMWEQKLAASKATETKPTPSHYAISPAAPISRPKAPAAGPSVQTTTIIQHPQQVSMGATQVLRPAPVRPHQTQPLDMSGAASTATMALPPAYQQQLLNGGFHLQQTSTGITAVIPASAIQSGNINIQQVTRQQMQPQNLSTKVQGQVDGAIDSTGAVDSEGAAGTSGQSSSAASLSAQDLSCRPKTTPLRRRRKPRKIEVIVQLDGADTSSDDDDVDDDEDDEDVDNEGGDGEGEEEPLNSGDDDDDEDASGSMSEMENVVVCQYDKITRSKNRWRFTLKDGIMNINQRDHVFHKAHGEAEW